MYGYIVIIINIKILYLINERKKVEKAEEEKRNVREGAETLLLVAQVASIKQYFELYEASNFFFIKKKFSNKFFKKKYTFL